MHAPKNKKGNLNGPPGRGDAFLAASFSSSTLVFVLGAQWNSIPIYTGCTNRFFKSRSTIQPYRVQWPNIHIDHSAGWKLYQPSLLTALLDLPFFILPLMEKLPSLTRYMCMTGVPTLIKMPFRQKARLWSKAARLGILGKASKSGMRRKKLCRSCCNFESCEWRMAL